ncbi:MAG: DUF1571 domain-containing protein [Pirellulaceae bacterium]|nr:DUF1571 domain-containing protein [Planctomycetales bacterium]
MTGNLYRAEKADRYASGGSARDLGQAGDLGTNRRRNEIDPIDPGGDCDDDQRKETSLMMYGGNKRLGAQSCIPFLMVAAVLALVCRAEEAVPSREALTEPVYRVTRSVNEPKAPAHPLDPCLCMAEKALQHVQANVDDYTCMVRKQERMENGTLLPAETFFAKIRNRKMQNGKTIVPFSVYLKFTEPAAARGREVVYVENANNGKLYAHEAGMKRFMKAWLDPHGPIAMRNNRYPLTDIGVENLTSKLIERGSRDRQHAECEVKVIPGAKINGRVCTCIQVMHPEHRPYFDFHVARIFLDDEFGFPTRYEAHTWPTSGTGKPELIEEYTYYDVQVNVGLTDVDFDPSNSSYQF